MGEMNPWPAEELPKQDKTGDAVRNGTVDLMA
jgi:hypothetical protein